MTSKRRPGLVWSQSQTYNDTLLAQHASKCASYQYLVWSKSYIDQVPPPSSFDRYPLYFESYSVMGRCTKNTKLPLVDCWSTMLKRPFLPLGHKSQVTSHKSQTVTRFRSNISPWQPKAAYSPPQMQRWCHDGCVGAEDGVGGGRASRLDAVTSCLCCFCGRGEVTLTVWLPMLARLLGS